MSGYKRKRPTYKKKATKKPYRKTDKKNSFAAKVKKVVMKVAETKRFSVPWTKIELYHNVLSQSQMLVLNGVSVMPGINVTQSGRIGDQINVKKNPWLLGKMFESRFPHASGREEG